MTRRGKYDDSMKGYGMELTEGKVRHQTKAKIKSPEERERTKPSAPPSAATPKRALDLEVFLRRHNQFIMNEGERTVARGLIQQLAEEGYLTLKNSD